MTFSIIMLSIENPDLTKTEFKIFPLPDQDQDEAVAFITVTNYNDQGWEVFENPAFFSVALYYVACGRGEFEPVNEYDVAILMKCLESHGHVNPGIAKSLAYAIFCNSISMAKAKPDDDGPRIILP